jgi:transposase
MSIRLIVCRNPALAEERVRKRDDLLQATERDLAKIEQAVKRIGRRALRGQAEIALKVGAVLDRYKMAKHLKLTITDDHFCVARDSETIAKEAALDGIYVIRTSLPKETLSDEGAVRAYKSLAQVERAFRALKTIDLQIQPLHHRLASRVRAHVFLCMLAYHVEAPMLYDETDREAADAMRESVVARPERSPVARAKQAKRRTEDGLPVLSFRSLLAELATLTRNTTVAPLNDDHELTLYARPTPIQTKAFELLGIKPERTQ